MIVMTVSEIINYEHFHTPDKRIMEFLAERHFLSHLYFFLLRGYFPWLWISIWRWSCVRVIFSPSEKKFSLEVSGKKLIWWESSLSTELDAFPISCKYLHLRRFLVFGEKFSCFLLFWLIYNTFYTL